MKKLQCKIFSSKFAKICLLSVLGMLGSTFHSFGQDAKVLPIKCDFPIEEPPMLSLENIINRNNAVQDNNNHLYEHSWNNTWVHCYGSIEKPDTFEINLEGFVFPVKSKRVSSNFGYRPRFKRYHKGIDIAAPSGDTIYSVLDGVVRVVRYEASGYGNFVVVRHNNGMETIYGHMTKQLCSVNDTVKAGQPIGLVGNTGRSFGSHLHFETRFIGEAIDPALLCDFTRQVVLKNNFTYYRHESENGMITAKK